MIKVRHKGICLKLRKAVAEEHVAEVTAYLQNCAEKIHEQYLKDIDAAMKELLFNLRIEDPTGEIYGRGPEDLTSTDTSTKLTSTDIS